jgi:PAS domain S-box-containing protein
VPPLRILHLEDNPSDAELIKNHLERGGMNATITRVPDRASFEQELKSEYELILADYSLQDFSGLEALHMVEQAKLEIPFVFVTGTLGDERAVELLVSGATDLVLKDRLGRLVPSIRRALREAQEHRERDRISRELAQSQERYRAFIHHSSEAIWRYELEKPVPIDLPEDEQIDMFYKYGYLAECNLAMARMYGYDSPESMIGIRIEQTMPRDNHRNIEFLRQFIRSGYRLTNAESEDIDAQGNRLYALNNLVGIIENGCGVRAWGSNRDITQRKRAEQALSQSEAIANRRLAELQVIYEDAPIGLCLLDTQLRFVKVNQRLAEFNGMSVQDHIGKTVKQIVPELSDRLEPIFRRILESRTPVENLEISGPDPLDPNRMRHWLVSYHPVIGETGLVASGQKSLRDHLASETTGREPTIYGISGVIQDISDRKKIESTLRMSESRTRAMLDTALDCIITIDRNSRIVEFNPAAERTFGYSRAQAIGRSVAETIIPPSLREGFDRGFKQYLQSGQAVVIGHRVEMPAMRADGTEFPAELAISVGRSSGEEQAGNDDIFFTAYVRDISDRIGAEEALRHSEERYRTIVSQVKDYAIFMIDLQGCASSWNQGVHGVLGYDEHNFIGQPVAVLYTAEDRSKGFPQVEMDEAARSGQALNDRWMVRKDGSRFFAAGITSALRDRNGHLIGFTKVMRDRTAARQAEAELVRHREQLEHTVAQKTTELQQSHQRLRLSERMAALGTLSAGLGHDMGNLLLPIRTRLDLIESKDQQGQLRDEIGAIRTAAEYLNRLVHGLRLLSLDPDDTTASGETTDLYGWWPGAESVLKNALPRGVELERKFSPTLPRVRLAPHLVMQAVFNLVQNAGDAMGPMPQGFVRVWAEPSPDRSIMHIGVTDNGPGMSPEVQLRCLEPFYTTKTRGISTGLGLALVHGIVRHAGGSVQIESTPGKGTTVTLTLPAADASLIEQGESHIRPLAAVSLNDQRLRSFVDSVLDALEFDVTLEQPRGNSDVLLWVTQPDDGWADRVRLFLDGDRRRRVVLVGAQGDGHGMARTARLVTATGAAPGVIQLSGTPKPGLIRQTLRAVAGEVSHAPAAASSSSQKSSGKPFNGPARNGS